MNDVASLFRRYMDLQWKREREGLSLEELQRWVAMKRRLNRHFQPDMADVHEGRRESVRVPFRLQVAYDSYDGIKECLMTNLSRGGLFVATPTQLPIGSKLEIRIYIEAAARSLKLPAEVVSHNVGPNLSTEETGMGVRFLGLSQDQQKAIDDLYMKAAGHAVDRRDPSKE